MARGGSRIDALLQAAPAEAVTGRLRITEQGETISQSYGLRPNAMRTLERAFNALTLATHAAARDPENVGREPPGALDCAATIARHSYEHWHALVITEGDFYDYFRAATPIDVIERMQIGSRSVYEGPPGRSAVEALRSTPWVFAWSQTRCMMPGWFGMGTGLTCAREAHGLEMLQQCYQEWGFFRTLIDDVEAILARTDLDIAHHYDSLASEPLRRYAAPLRAEYDRACEQLLAIKGSTDLLDTDRTLQRGIQLRNPYVDPMNLMQVDLLRRWRAGARQDTELLDALLASVSGIAQGLQTTG